jgi:phosphonopyruvate decarboxylase
MIQQAVQIRPQAFTQSLKQAGLGPVIEVPCSYFKDWLNFLWHSHDMEVINPVNEALAMGRAAGRYLATGKIPIVALQNSGFMNSLNALTSLNQIYDIPVFYIITWRGEGGPGSDVPVHDMTGGYLLDYLRVLQIPYGIAQPEEYEGQIQALARKARKTRKPVSLVVRKDTFAPYHIQDRAEAVQSRAMSRFEAISIIKRAVQDTDTLLVSSTGFPSRDAFAVSDTPDFYILGSMGHAFEIGLGIAEGTARKVLVLEGDGSALMHVGGLADFNPEMHTNLIYVVLDNASYESTGGQPTVSAHVDWEQLAQAFRFDSYRTASSTEELQRIVMESLASDSGQVIHVSIRNDNRFAPRMVSDVYTARQITDRFMEEVNRPPSRSL